jgi:hypothetical protein
MAFKNDRRKKTYQCYQDMKQRCLNKKHSMFKNYGARGITICARWLESFDNFLADMGEKPDGLTLDRINNNAGYSPDNCRWATPAQQRVNQRDCVYLEFQGKRMTVAEWGREIGRHQTTIRSRIRSGYPIELVLSPKIWKNGKIPGPVTAMKKGE